MIGRVAKVLLQTAAFVQFCSLVLLIKLRFFQNTNHCRSVCQDFRKTWQRSRVNRMDFRSFSVSFHTFSRYISYITTTYYYYSYLIFNHWFCLYILLLSDSKHFHWLGKFCLLHARLRGREWTIFRRSIAVRLGHGVITLWSWDSGREG